MKWGGVTNLLHDSVPTKLYGDNTPSPDDLHWGPTSGGPGKPSIVELGSDMDVRYGFQILNNASGTNRDFAQRGQFIQPNSGKYTFTVWTKLLSNDYVDGRGIFRSWSSDGKNPWIAFGHKDVFDKWVLEKFTFDTTGWSNATWYSLQMGINGGGSIQLAKPMLVQGEVAANWAPRPEEEPIAWK